MLPKTEIDVAHVAKLARLNLTAEEAALFQRQLGRVLEYAAKLRAAVVAGVSPAEENEEDAGETPATTPQREDEPRPWFTAEEALSNAPRQSNDLFVVPKVME
ncbi:MAG: Asp-tRNA(Asn)/Glu-tRNA(Gln) amidotransferase GatCAB subunit C [Verrucomicrobia bacterium]|nr:MAG: Asp-tRNA(Asn)/Glu-tRNA(Gln) amidotransferase GatCAB subunit C [Verrucomicrobiota bacterium]